MITVFLEGTTTTVTPHSENENSTANPSDSADNSGITIFAENITTTENPRARIIGGEPAYEGEFKYQLSVRLFGRRHHCGASLINVEEEQLAITAAHCVRELLPDDVTLVAGDLTRSDRSGHEQERQVE